MKKRSGELKQDRQQLMGKVDNLISKAESENRNFTNDENRTFEDLKSQISDLDIKIRNADWDEAKKRRIEESKMKGIKNDEPIKQVLAQVAKALKTGKGPEEIRTLTSTGAGATIQDPNIVNQVIYGLQAYNPLVDAGARYVNLQDNHEQYPRVKGYPTAQWVSEGDQITDSIPIIEAVKFDARDVVCLIKVQNQALMDSSDRAERLVNETIARAINDAILRAVLYGEAVNKQPVGLDSIAGVQSVDMGSTTFSSHDKILDCVGALMGANVNAKNISSISSPSVAIQLAKLKSVDSMPLQKPDFVKDMPMFWSTAVKSDYGAGNDETRMYLGDFSQLVVGFAGTFQMTLSERYSDYLQTGFMLHTRVDVKAFHPDNFCILENITA